MECRGFNPRFCIYSLVASGVSGFNPRRCIYNMMYLLANWTKQMEPFKINFNQHRTKHAFTNEVFAKLKVLLLLIYFCTGCVTGHSSLLQYFPWQHNSGLNWRITSGTALMEWTHTRSTIASSASATSKY
jgi:hypothetical protein